MKRMVQFVNRCTKPSREGQLLLSRAKFSNLTAKKDQVRLTRGVVLIFAEYVQLCKAVAIGFAVMGFIGYFVKLIHIPMYVPPAVNRVP